MNTSLNTAPAVLSTVPAFLLALVLQPRDWDIFIPDPCISQALSIILQKSALSWKWEGWLWWGQLMAFPWDTQSLSASLTSHCAPTLPNMTFWNAVYHFCAVLTTGTCTSTQLLAPLIKRKQSLWAADVGGRRTYLWVFIRHTTISGDHG